MGTPRAILAGVIGCGAFGSGILAQAGSVPHLRVAAAADSDVDAARRAFLAGGVPEGAMVTCETEDAARRALDGGKRVIAADPLLLIGLPLDVVVEATGSPESGAVHAEAAIHAGRHVAMVNKEADVSVGPILRRMAGEAGVVYTPVDGDQHGLIIRLVGWARGLGLEVLCAGKSRDREIVCDPAGGVLSSGSQQRPLTPGAAKLFEPLPEGQSLTEGGLERLLAARREELGEWGRIGGWDLVELAIAANATGLNPDLLEGVHCPALYASEIPRVLSPAELGGILGSRGLIDAVTCLRRPGETGLGGGVFAVVTAPNAAARRVLSRGAVCHDGAGEAALITRPYHLLGVEAINTVLEAVLSGRVADSGDYRPRFDVFARAARDLAAGTVLGGDHSSELEAFLGPAAPFAPGRALPLHLGSGNRLLRAIPQGGVITREAVAAPDASPLWRLRAEQDAWFFGGDGS